MSSPTSPAPPASFCLVTAAELAAPLLAPALTSSLSSAGPVADHLLFAAFFFFFCRFERFCGLDGCCPASAPASTSPSSSSTPVDSVLTGSETNESHTHTHTHTH